MLNNDLSSTKQITEKIPTISVVLNVYNESENIEECLSRIRSQNYPQNRIEIIIVDDKSEDNTVELAKKFNVIVFTSGYRNRERAKSIGIEHARGEFILFMDADVFLIGKDWIKNAVKFLLENPKAAAVQSIRWKYKRNDYLANRYCNLFGINDPLVLFLGKRGALMATEREWPYKNTIIERGKDYYLARFNTTNLPTMGAQGYIARRDLILKTNWKPYFFHLDSNYELVEMDHNEFIFAFLEIEHRYVKSFLQFFRKLKRNFKLFLELRKYRKYTYEVSFLKLIIALFLMLSIVYPLWQSLRGYLKKPDFAWFLHPLFCFTVPIMYTFVLVKWRIQLLWGKNLTL